MFWPGARASWGGAGTRRRGASPQTSRETAARTEAVAGTGARGLCARGRGRRQRRLRRFGAHHGAFLKFRLEKTHRT